MNAKKAERYGPWALVTGSSSGIGEEFANQLAAAGLNLVLAARRQEKLEKIAERLRQAHDVEVKVVPVDLTDEHFLATLRETTDALDVGLVISSAGGAAMGALVSRENDAVDWLIRLNVRAPTLIANHYGKRLAARGRGGLVLVASTVASQPTALIGEYGATKAHQLYLDESLHGELKQHGVDVTVLNPGPTRTEMVAGTDGFDPSKIPMMWMETPAVVRAGLNALGKKRHFPRLAGAMFTSMMSKAMAASHVSGIGAVSRIGSPGVAPVNVVR